MHSDAFARVIAWDNLLRAYQRAAESKRGRAPAATFERRLADNLIGLQDELTAHRYQPGAYTHFYIHEPERRKISAAPFRDRVVHHALCGVIEPWFERRFIFDSYADTWGLRRHVLDVPIPSHPSPPLPPARFDDAEQMYHHSGELDEVQL